MHANDVCGPARPGFCDAGLAQRFEDDGYFTAPLLSEVEVRELAELYERLHPGPDSGFHLTGAVHDEALRRRIALELEERVGPKLDQLLPGYRPCLWFFIVKEAGTQEPLQFHQDWTLVDEQRFTTVHCWFPLVDVDARNGCLYLLPGSHRLGDRIRTCDSTYVFRDVLAHLRDSGQLRDLPLHTGEAMFYHGRLAHGSGPNYSHRRRVAVLSARVPQGAALEQWHRVTAQEVERYAVDDEYFFTSIAGERPRQGRLIERAAYPAWRYSLETLAADQAQCRSTGQAPA